MATTDEQQLAQQAPRVRCESPSDETTPAPALGPYPQPSRSSSSVSHLSSTTASRDSLGSDGFSRHSSSSYRSRSSDVSILSRRSTNSHEEGKSRRRGYMRPHGTDFAASARSRESVMSLGSIAHLQYYFARTGLLDGKGGQLARKKPKGAATLDLSALEGGVTAEGDFSYASTGSSLVASPVRETAEGDEEEEGDEFEDSFTESEAGMLLDPTVSTYNHRQVPLPKPPTMNELKAELEATLTDAGQALREVREQKAGTYVDPPDAPQYPNMPEKDTQGWYELQGIHILDVVTLAIRAAKMYYTAHELPDRLDTIKPERQVRADLLLVMETLKQMGVRNFKSGMRSEEIDIMERWIASVWDILRQEQAIDAAEKAEREGWKWLKGGAAWTGRERERERAFLASMENPGAEPPLPEWTTPTASKEDLPSPFLLAMRDGVRLIKLHNASVKKSRRRFGAIPSFHTDTQKPYHGADNLRYWVKAAELRFEVHLSIDALALQYQSSSRDVWVQFEEAILKWCRRVREEIAGELDGEEGVAS